MFRLHLSPGGDLSVNDHPMPGQSGDDSIQWAVTQIEAQRVGKSAPMTVQFTDERDTGYGARTVSANPGEPVTFEMVTRDPAPVAATPMVEDDWASALAQVEEAAKPAAHKDERGDLFADRGEFVAPDEVADIDVDLWDVEVDEGASWDKPVDGMGQEEHLFAYERDRPHVNLDAKGRPQSTRNPWIMRGVVIALVLAVAGLFAGRALLAPTPGQVCVDTRTSLRVAAAKCDKPSEFISTWYVPDAKVVPSVGQPVTEGGKAKPSKEAVKVPD